MSKNEIEKIGSTDDLDKLTEKLQKYYDNLSNEQTLNELINLFNSKVMRGIFDVSLEYSENEDFKREVDSKYLASYIKLLRIILKLCNSVYNSTGSDTGLSDSEYDELIEFYKSISGDESIITESLINTESEAHHKFKTLRGTLDKIYKITDEDVLKNKSQKSLDDWVMQTEKRYFENTGKHIDLMECDVIVMPKFDGVSCVFECDENGKMIRALTRGDTSQNKAQDITHIFKGMFKGSLENQSTPYGEKTEVMMLDDKLREYNELYHKDYKNTRSIVSSILNSKEKDERVDYLHIVPLRISFMNDGEESQQILAPEVMSYPHINCKLKDLDDIHDFAFKHKTVYPGLRCDGAVIQIVDPDIQKALGRENEKQKFEVAFKFTEETAYSKVIDIEFTAGLFGRMNPVVVFKPVKMKGNTVERASLGSYGRFKDLELCKGDEIKVLYDIIPYVDFDEKDYKCTRSGKNVIEAPKYCPDCGSSLELSDDGGILRCNNAFCPCREKGKILNFCQKMHISNISYATVDDFYREGILNSIKDLYTLKNHVNEISQLPGYGTGKISKILDEIDTHRDVEVSTLLGSIGIEGLSIKKFKNLLSYMSMDEVLDVCNEGNITFFTVIPGIKEKTAEKLVNGINNNRELIEFFKKELNIKNDSGNGDFTVCFTKVREDDIPGLVDLINNAGGTIDNNSLTKKTSLLVVPTLNTESSKVSKAKKYGIPIVAIGDVKDYITKNYL